MSRFVRSWGQVVGSAAVLGFLVWRLGTGPFLAGLRSIDGPTLAAATGLMVLTTFCSAWRWKTVAGGLGVDLSLPAAVAAYYRSVFLNLTLPGGVVGDVHRAVRHGREVRDVGRASRAVAWERTAGQVVQVSLTLAVLLTLPSPLHSSMPVVALAVVGTAIGLVLLVRRRPSDPRSVWARTRSAVVRDIREGLLAQGAWLRIALASAVVVAGHTATFLIAAQTAGATASVPRMLPLALLAMVAMVLPSVGGWGPREGATAWIFAAAGLGAQRGVATAVVYGVMILFASLPGAAVLLVAWFRGIRAPRRAERPLREQAAHA